MSMCAVVLRITRASYADIAVQYKRCFACNAASPALKTIPSMMIRHTMPGPVDEFQRKPFGDTWNAGAAGPVHLAPAWTMDAFACIDGTIYERVPRNATRALKTRSGRNLRRSLRRLDPNGTGYLNSAECVWTYP
jgi:hypothetical protein